MPNSTRRPGSNGPLPDDAQQVVIDQATGILELLYRIDSNQAFAVLSSWAKRNETSIAEAAERFVRAVRREDVNLSLRRGRNGEDAVVIEAGTASAQLEVRTRLSSSLPVIRLSGELDIGSVGQLRAAVAEVMSAGLSAQLMVLDMSAVTFCDVAGLRAVEDAARALEAREMELVLYGTPESVVRLIEVTGVAGSVSRR